MKIRNNSRTYLEGIDKSYFNIEDRCPYTDNQLMLEWQARIQAEFARPDYRWFFFTFTYDDFHLPVTTFNLGADSVVLRHFNPEHISAFLKRIHNPIPRLRHYICAEFGSTTQRPHYHGLLGVPVNFFDENSVEDLCDLVQKYWHEEFPTRDSDGNILYNEDGSPQYSSLGFIMPNKDVTADDSTRDIYYLPHDFFDKHGIKKHYHGVEVLPDQLPQMSSYVAKYVVKDCSYYSLPEVKLVKNYVLKISQLKRMLRDANKWSLCPPDSDEYHRYMEMYDEYLNCLDVRSKFLRCECFHRQSIGFGVTLLDEYDAYTDMIELRKRIRKGVNIGVTRKGKALQAPVPKYILRKLFYDSVKEYDKGQFCNKYYRVKNDKYKKYLMINFPEIIREKQYAYRTSFDRWYKFSHKDIKTVLEQYGIRSDEFLFTWLALYSTCFRDCTATFPIQDTDEALRYACQIYALRSYHADTPYNRTDFDVPLYEQLFSDLEHKNIVLSATENDGIIVVPSLYSQKPDAPLPLYNDLPFFSDLEELCQIYDDWIRAEKYARYARFKKDYDELQDYKHRTVGVSH